YHVGSQDKSRHIFYMRALVIKRVNYILIVNYLEYSYIINIQYIISKAEFACFVGTDKSMEWKLCNNMLTSNSLQRDKPSRVVAIVHCAPTSSLYPLLSFFTAQ